MALDCGAFLGCARVNVWMVERELAQLSRVIFDPSSGAVGRGNERVGVLLYTSIRAYVVVVRMCVEDNAHVGRANARDLQQLADERIRAGQTCVDQHRVLPDHHMQVERNFGCQGLLELPNVSIKAGDARAVGER
jgi:hypothetical protein